MSWRALLVFAACSLSAVAESQVKTEGQAQKQDRQDQADDLAEPGGGGDASWSWAAVPTLTYNSDEGWGTGGVGTVYRRLPEYEPYKDALTLKIFISSKLIQAHEINWDGLGVAGLPLRVFARVGYYSTVTQNFCGFGNSVACDLAEAERQAHKQGFVAGRSDYEEFVRHYYLMRFMRFYGDLLLRYQLRDKPHRLEILAGWRASYFLPGELGQAGPYAGSLYAQTFPKGESGFSSVPFVGFVLDNRDAETFPTQGYVLESSLRGAAPLTGATWTYAGANMSFASFHRLLSSPRTVFAVRFVADVLIGDPSTEELARVGGTVDAIAFGGQAMGRGIREHRYLGKLKAIHQAELRSQFWDFVVLEQKLSLGAALFYDVAGIVYDYEDPRGDPGRLRWGAGTSLRVIWNRDFIVRFDVAGSPVEPGVPGIYVIVGNVF